MIERGQLKSIEKIFGRKAVVILGPRQVGKSTLLHQMLDGEDNVRWLNGDDQDVRELFENFSAAKMRTILGKNTTLALDEAQRIPEIGLKLKIVTDQMKDVKIITTGSSSLDLAAGLNESLSGRKREFILLPLTFKELTDHHGLLEEKRLLHRRMIYGYYPEVVTTPGEERDILREIVGSYLYKDILNLDLVAKPEKLSKLVQALAYQIGSQVSYNEIAQLIGLDSKTVERYVDILEKCFVIFRVNSFSRNLRNELKSSKKIFFWDCGIRNAIINNFAPVEKRSPIENGALWENWIIAERLKYNNLTGERTTPWFWRTKQQSEIDYIEDKDGIISAFEFKWNPKAKASLPPLFATSYPDATFKVITPQNCENFICLEETPSILKITDAKYIKDYILCLTFNTGEERLCDFLPLAKKGICQKLQNMEYFRNFRLDPFTVDWNNEIGFAPEYLLQHSTKI